VAFAWVWSGLGTHVFSCRSSPGRDPESSKLVRFETGQPLGFLSSWPLFALTHHFMVWFAAEQVYPQAKFSNVALLGDDIVIADPRVAERYLDIINQLGVQVSKQKSRIFHTGCFEFAKKFIIHSETARLVSSERENVALLSTFDRLDACMSFIRH